MQIIAFKTSQIVLHMIVAFIVTYAFTGSLAVGGLAALVEPICNVTLMPLHDKLWARVRSRRQARNHVTAADEPLSSAAGDIRHQGVECAFSDSCVLFMTPACKQATGC